MPFGAGTDETTSIYVNAIAEPDLAGKTLSVLSGETTLARTPVMTDGGRATAQLRLPFPPVGETPSDLLVQLDGWTVQTLRLPDATALAQTDVPVRARLGVG